MDPLVKLQLGCVTDTIGAAGDTGCGLITAGADVLEHPAGRLTLTLYVPGARLEKDVPMM